MFCTNCGNKLEDNALFCTNCGQKVETEEPKVEETPVVEEPKAEEPKVEETPVVEEPKVEETPVVEESKVEETPAVEESKVEETPVIPVNIPSKAEPENVKPKRTIAQELKRFVISPLVIIALICFTAFIITSIMEAGSIFTDTFDKITDTFSDRSSAYYVEDFDIVLDEYFNDVFGIAVDAVNDVFKIFALILLLPDVIVCACLWVTVLSAFDKKALSATTAGLTTIKVMNIISLVFTSIICLLALADVVFGIIGLITDQYLFAVSTLLVAVIVLPIYLFKLYYQIKINSTINSFTHTLKRNTVINSASKFVAVILMIEGILQCLMGLLSTGTVSTWLGAVSTICFSVIIFKFRNLCEYMLSQNRE